MELFSYILSQSVRCWYIDRLLTFINRFLYPATFLKMFMMSKSFLVGFSGTFRYKIMSSASRDSLTSSFPI
jgi:hypothetical protein